MTVQSATAMPERRLLHLCAQRNEELDAFLDMSGWQSLPAKTPRDAMHLLERERFATGIIELGGYTEADFAALEACMSHGGDMIQWVALVTRGQTDSPVVRQFILDHCFDYITTPCPHTLITHALGHAYGLASLREPTDKLNAPLHTHDMIGRCDAMQRLQRDIGKVAVTNAPVYISGESGTGKELTAVAIHKLSARRDGPFIAINCGAIPPHLAQSELFGYERGAFTGANQRKLGRIELANGGTLFLDEIGDLPPDCQASILRFLQEGTIERLGGAEPIAVDVRIVSATHVDLDAAIAAGRFRLDLYHRLCVLALHEPPLRERGADIRLLATHLLHKYRRDSTHKMRGFSRDALGAMYSYAWPGNVRELINRVRRAIVMADGRFVSAEDLGLPSQLASEHPTLNEIRGQAERHGLEEALQRHRYNLTDAARELGVSRATLYRLIRSAGLKVDPALVPHIVLAPDPDEIQALAS